jgi:hypothetical protein
MRAVGWVATVVVAGAVLGALVAGATSTADIRRYLRMRRM